ncbi:hypothetical protein BZA05DRAFT_400655 [Tricharina praecox]|uniref:uncharacterized protein n=1 Tax=Tricharina praecox TaxID=43433 RepID=UPI00221E574A|nr:uncharacterized protein BZA05DRAFT_400655 [Tricharina praecox]KAI5850023.1 hypothetical protein BZA05DRAFT_400655 [Tricharina praecox]
MLERQENARKRQEEMEKQRRAEFRNWMVDDFIVIEDCTGKKRWVVADSNVQVPKDVRYLDDSEYRFTPDIDSKPLDEYRDPRELYVTDDRPAGGFLCEHFSECNCFRKPPAQLPKTVLFTTADGRGIGLRALRSIKKGEYIGEYRGVIEVYDNNEKRPDVVQAMKNRDMRYAIGGHWDADTEFGVDEAGRTKSFSYYIDALKSGTETRFINHHCDPKVVNVEYVDENHKGRMVQAIRTTKLIPKGWEILIDYGTFDDWHSYGGHCLCRSNVCRYLINAGARSPYVVAIQMPSDEWSMVQLVPDPEIKPFKAGARLRVAKQKCSYHLRYERFKRRQKPVEHKKPRHELSVWPNVRIKVLYQQHLRAGVKERDSRYVWKQVRASVKEADDGDGE